MVHKVAEFGLKQVGLDWVVAPEWKGHAMYRITSIAVGEPLHFGISFLANDYFSEKPEIPKDKVLTNLLANFNFRKISSKDELLKKIFNIVVSLALFIPATLIAKEVVIAMGFTQLSMVTTPLLTLLQEEMFSLLMTEFIGHLIGTVAIYVDQ